MGKYDTINATLANQLLLKLKNDSIESYIQWYCFHNGISCNHTIITLQL